MRKVFEVTIQYYLANRASNRGEKKTIGECENAYRRHISLEFKVYTLKHNLEFISIPIFKKCIEVEK